MDRSNSFKNHFKKRLLTTTSVGLLLSCLSVAAISIWPLYHQLETLQTNRLVFMVKSKTMMVNQFLESAIQVTKQITSRSNARKLLEQYNANIINLATYQKLSTAILQDSLDSSRFAAGISRLDKQGKLVIQVGLPVPKKFLYSPDITNSMPILSGPITINKRLFIMVRAPILNKQKNHVGMDIVFFTMSSLKAMVQSYAGLGVTEEMVLGRLQADKQPQIFYTMRLARKPGQALAASWNLAMVRKIIKQASLSDHKKTIYLLKNDNELAAYAFVKDIGWNVIVIMDQSELFQEVTRQVLIIALVILVLIIPLGLIGLILLLRPLSSRVLIHVDALQQEITAKENAIQKRDLAEQKLLAEKEQLRVTLHSIGDAVITTDLNGHIVLMNKIAEQLTGWNLQQAIGQPLHGIFNIISGKTREPCDNPAEKVLALKKIVGLANHTILVSKNGTEYQIADSGAPIKDGKGEILGVVLVFRDVTQQYQTEEALRRSQKMDAIGQLSGGIAHDFNNQLGIVIGYLDFLQDYTVNDEEPKKWVTTATRATLRCMDLTRQLLAFSRHQSKERTVVDLNASLRELETMIARSLTPEVEVQYFLIDDLWPTTIDPGEFQDAILNLVINARDAMPGGGKLLIETSNKYLDANYASLNPEIAANDYVQLMLSDTGTGMDKKTLDRIFEPFFTTKPKDKGTGLGLSMVYGFTKRYGGYIKVYSELDVGTTIRLYLPRSAASKAVTIADGHQAAALPTGHEVILIVDDEADLLQLADQYLSNLGYQTYLAQNASQALELLARQKNIDLLFSDVVMPGGMNGYELAKQATQQQANLKVLLTSGFTSKAIVNNGLTRFSTHLLSKPYRKAELAQRIRHVLDDKSVLNRKDNL